MKSKTRSLFKKLPRWFRQMVTDLYLQFRDSEIRMVAASLSFSTILSIVPFMAVVLAVFQALGGNETLYPRVENMLLQYFKEAAGGQFTQVIKNSIGNIQAGRLGTTGALVLGWASFRLLNDMEYGIHRVWNQKNTRPLFKRIFVYWFVMMILPIGLAMYLAFATFLQANVSKGHLGALFGGTGALYIILFLVYKFVPDVKVRTSPAAFSSFLATIGLVVVQNSYSWVAVTFFRYSRIYGGFAAVPIFLLWILTIWYVILGGVAICASTQRRELAAE